MDLQKDIAKLLAEAELFMSEQKYDAAIAKFRQAREKLDNSETRSALTMAYIKNTVWLLNNSQPAVAFENLKSAIEVNNKEKKHDLGELEQLFQQGKTIEEFISGYIAYVLDGSLPAIYYQFLWELPFRKTDYIKLQKVFDNALHKHPRNHDFRRHSGIVEWQLGNYKRSAGCFEELIKADHYSYNDVYYLCDCYDKNKQVDKVIEKISKAILKEPESPDYYSLSWNYYLKYNRATDAISFYKEVLDIHKDISVAYVFYAYALQSENKFEEAEKSMEKAIDLSSDPAMGYYDLGNVYLYSLRYGKALDQYSNALAQRKPEDAHIFALHNIAWIYEKLGDYKKARDQWRKAVSYYEKEIEKTYGHRYNLVDLNYYCAGIYLFSFYDFNAEKIEALLANAIRLAPEYTPLHLLMVKFYKEKKLRLGEKLDKNKDDLKDQINEAHIKVLEHLRQGIFLAKKSVEEFPNKFNYSQLGEFYLEQEKPEEAKENYNKALRLDDFYLAACVGLGVALVKCGEFKEAIRVFKRALEMDPDSLHVQNNLGEAYRKALLYDLAEETFQKILSVTAFHVDALVGLAECNSMRGDKAVEEKNINAAEEYFSNAKNQLTTALNLNDEKASRRFNRTEKSTLYYSLGYVKVKLAEMKKGWDFQSMLASAKNDFEMILENQPEYFKARKALKKINERRFSFLSIRKSAPRIIFFLSLLIFFGVLYIFIFSRFEKKDKYSLNNNELIYLLRQQKQDSLMKNFSVLDSLEFSSAKSLEDKISAVAPPGFLTADIRDKIVDHEKVNVDEKMTEVTFVFFIFGSLIFMVIGLFLTDITRLKVGSIEMDKNAVDNVSTTPSLGIGR